MNDVESKKLKSGFTTGSAATAAAKASLIMLITGEKTDSCEIMTPAGIKYSPKIYDQEIVFIQKNDNCQVSANNQNDADSYSACCVIKESGDDPDITSGTKIFAKVSVIRNTGREISITGGKGIGRVTRPGLDQPVGEWAINSTPRRMIRETLTDVLESNDLDWSLNVEISIPDGVELAAKTFNPHMGIEGGISVIGTSGIVKPMSEEALVDTIRLDINMQYSEGREVCVIVPGNYGVTFLKKNYGIDEKDIVLCSNYVGDSIRIAADTGFRRILFCSHIGKLIKVSGGIMNTHSKYGDHRMELMAKAYTEMCINKGISADKEVVSKILDCISTTAALDILCEIGCMKEVSKIIVKNAVNHLHKASSREDMKIDCILYENSYGELARITGE